MVGTISGTGRAKKIEAFAKKRSAKRTRLAKEVQGKHKELDIKRKEFIKKTKLKRV